MKHPSRRQTIREKQWTGAGVGNVKKWAALLLGLLFLLLAPFSEFLLGMEADMLRAIQRLLSMMAG